jgi:hypothetical protein
LFLTAEAAQNDPGISPEWGPEWGPRMGIRSGCHAQFFVSAQRLTHSNDLLTITESVI